MSSSRTDVVQAAQSSFWTDDRRFRVPTRMEAFAAAFVAGCAMFILTLLAQWYIYVYFLGEYGLRMVGDVVAGILTFILVHRMIAASRTRRLATLHRFQTIAEMNHHIRNSLQTIAYQRYAIDDAVAAARLKEAVERIEWVLEQVLPAVQDDSGKPNREGGAEAA